MNKFKHIGIAFLVINLISLLVFVLPGLDHRYLPSIIAETIGGAILLGLIGSLFYYLAGRSKKAFYISVLILGALGALGALAA